MSVRYPVAANAEAALSGPTGHAAREREAAILSGRNVEFVRETAGPAFETREAALAAYAGRVDDDGGTAVQPEDRYCDVVEVVVGAAKPGGQIEPAFQGGRRWPKPKPRPRTAWRLSIAYWRVLGVGEMTPALEQARRARKTGHSETLDAATLLALARQPLQPVKPQQPLDIGLFEVRPPDAPHIIMPDE